MLLFELVKDAQNGNEKCQLELLNKFQPLLRKYAAKLQIEDAYEMLQADLIAIILTMVTNNLHSQNDGVYVKYFETCIYRSFLSYIKNKNNDLNNLLYYDSMELSQQHRVAVKYSTIDSYFANEFHWIHKILTDKEYKIIVAIYIYGQSTVEIAEKFGVSRQNINQIKQNALKKLKPYAELNK